MHRPTPRPKNARRATGLLRHRMMVGRQPVRMRPARRKPTLPCLPGSRPGRTACRIAGDVGAAVGGRLISIRRVRSIRRPERPRAQPLRRAPQAIPAPRKRAAREADHSGRCCGCAIGAGTAAHARCRGSDRPRLAAERLRRREQPKARLRPKARRQRVARRRLAIVRAFGRAVAGGVRAFQSPGRHRGKPVKRSPRKGLQETQAPRRRPGRWELALPARATAAVAALEPHLPKTALHPQSARAAVAAAISG
jgi:hypothetical protein